MMRKISLGIVLWMCVWSASVWAQPRMGLRVAPSISQDHFFSKYGFGPLGFGDEHTEVHHSPVLPSGGVFIMFGNPKGVRFLTEIEYQPKRIYERERVNNITTPGLAAFGDKVLEHTVHYAVVGAITRFHTPQIFDVVQIFLDAGLRGNIKRGDNGDIPKTFNDEETLNLRGFDLSMRIGIGMNFEIQERLNLFWDLRYDHSIFKASNYGLSILGIGAADYHRLRVYSLGVGLMFEATNLLINR